MGTISQPVSITLGDSFNWGQYGQNMEAWVNLRLEYHVPWYPEGVLSIPTYTTHSLNPSHKPWNHSQSDGERSLEDIRKRSTNGTDLEIIDTRIDKKCMPEMGFMKSN